MVLTDTTGPGESNPTLSGTSNQISDMLDPDPIGQQDIAGPEIEQWLKDLIAKVSILLDMSAVQC